MSRFLSQVRRADRLLARVQNEDPEGETFIDDLFAFFQACWHVKDWMKNDPEAEPGLRDTIENRVKASEPLMLCADVANRSKHLVPSWSRRGGQLRARLTLEHAEISLRGGTLSFSRKYIVVADGSTEWPALELAASAMAEWHKILVEFAYE